MNRPIYVKPKEAHFRLENVRFSHRDKSGLYRVEWLKELSKPMNSEEIRDFNQKNYSAGDPIIISIPDAVSIFSQLNVKRDADFYNTLSDKFRNNVWINLSTNSFYAPAGEKDRMIHYEGLKDIKGQSDLEQIFEGHYVGHGGWLDELENGQIFKDFTGKTRRSLENVSQKINGTSGYLWRFNSSPESLTKAQAGLGADSGRFGFDADGDQSARVPGFRVVLERQN